VFKKYIWQWSIESTASGKDVEHEAPAESEGNIIVINTCGFIDNAKANQLIWLEYADKRRGLVDKVL
jgi:ribosomal protein S12 methylthiotransferase